VIRILIVDDDRAMRLVGHMLAEDEGCVVVGEADSGEEAVRLALRLAPDVVLMDFRMTGIDGAEATRLILDRRPGTTVIGWSATEETGVAEAFLAAGAREHAVKGDFAKLRSLLRGLGLGLPA
jgi:CheY-like chemotaxis protein